MDNKIVMDIVLGKGKKTYDFDPPLSYSSSEWKEIRPGLCVNKRIGSICMDNNLFNGQPYYMYGRIFSYDGGKTWCLTERSNVPVIFPLYELPETEPIIIEGEE